MQYFENLSTVIVHSYVKDIRYKKTVIFSYIKLFQ